MENNQVSTIIPFFPLNRIESELKQRWCEVFINVIDSGKFIRSDQNANFESEWAAACGVKHAVGVANGLDGLVLALRALAVGPGMTVAVPSHTFIATWNAVHLVGATPVGVDVDENGLLDLNQLESLAIIPDAVIPVHMHGMMVDMPRLVSWANQRKILVIEDASQAHLASYDGRCAGSFGQVGVFSLYPTKNLGALGDAGIVISDDLNVINKIQELGNYGADAIDKYHHSSIGMNSRLDELQAAILRENLKYLSSWNAKRRDLAQIYKSILKQNSDLRILGFEINSVWHHFPVLTTRRPKFLEFLNENGIGFDIHYPRLAAYEYFNALGRNSPKMTRGETIANEVVSLPLSPWHTESEIKFVAQTVNGFFK